MGIPPKVLQQIAEDPELNKLAGTVLDISYTAMICKEELENVILKNLPADNPMHVVKRGIPTLQVCPPPCPTGYDRNSWKTHPTYIKHVYANAAYTNIHYHVMTCHQGKSGQFWCREAYP